MEYWNAGVRNRFFGKMIFGFFVLALFVGCETTKIDPEAKPISWAKQKAYLSRSRDPRVFGMSIYQTPSGLQIRGGGRLHPSQAAALPMNVTEPFRPVVNLSDSFGRERPVLLDLVSSRTWLEFGAAQKMRCDWISCLLKAH